MLDKALLFIAAVMPVGRCNRTGMILVSTYVVSIEAGFLGALWAGGWTADGVAADLLRLFCLWMSFASFSKRLHDLGRSAWWLIGGAAVLIAWLCLISAALAILGGSAALQPGSPLFKLSVAAAVMPMIAAIFYLHLAAGQSEDNHYGPVPAPIGFSQPRPWRPDRRPLQWRLPSFDIAPTTRA